MALYEVECPRCHATFPVAASDLAVSCPRCAMHLDLVAEEAAMGADTAQPTMEFKRIEEPPFAVAPCPACEKPLLLAPDDESGLCAHCEAPLAFADGRALELPGSPRHESPAARSFAPLVFCRSVPAAAAPITTPPPPGPVEKRKKARGPGRAPGKNAAAGVRLLVCSEPLPESVIESPGPIFLPTATVSVVTYEPLAAPHPILFPVPFSLPPSSDVFCVAGFGLDLAAPLLMQAAGPPAPAPGVDVAASDDGGSAMTPTGSDEEPPAKKRPRRERKTLEVERKVDPDMPEGIPAALHGRKVKATRAAIEHCPECTHPFYVHPRDREAQCPHCLSYVALDPVLRRAAAPRGGQEAAAVPPAERPGEAKPGRLRRRKQHAARTAESPQTPDDKPPRLPWRRGRTKKAGEHAAGTATGAADEDLFVVEESVQVERKAPAVEEPQRASSAPAPAPAPPEDLDLELDFAEEPGPPRPPATPEPALRPADPAPPPAEDLGLELDLEEEPADTAPSPAQPALRPLTPASEPLEEEADESGIDLEPERQPGRTSTPLPREGPTPAGAAEPPSALPEPAPPVLPAPAAELEPVADESELASLPSFEVVSEEPVEDPEGKEKRGLFARFGRRAKQ